MSRHPLTEDELCQHMQGAAEAIEHTAELDIDRTRAQQITNEYNSFCSGVDDVIWQATALTHWINLIEPIREVDTGARLTRIIAVACGTNLLKQEARFKIDPTVSLQKAFIEYLQFREQLTVDGIRIFFDAIWEQSERMAEALGREK